jgi:hypothetical protein
MAIMQLMMMRRRMQMLMMMVVLMMILVKILGEADDYMHKEKEKFSALKDLYKNLKCLF